jgi:YegS/Rv2252/BmrU family lipid kinase
MAGQTVAIERALLLLNPAARRVASRGFDPAGVARWLERRGVQVRVAVPGSATDATREARVAAERGDDAVFAVGGDGTVRDVAAGLLGSATALAAIPGGTVNIWCKEMGLGQGMRGAFEAHLGGQCVAVDVGMAGERPFLLMASAGWDAAVAASVPPGWKRRLGDAAYVLEGLRRAPSLRPVPMRWRAGLITHDAPAVLMVVSNTRLYGGRVRFSPGALANDGLLDVAVLTPRTPADAVRLAAKLVAGRLVRDRCVVAVQAPELTIETPGVPLQLDGDPAGETPVTLRIRAGALLASIPAGPLPPVLGGP